MRFDHTAGSILVLSDNSLAAPSIGMLPFAYESGQHAPGESVYELASEARATPTRFSVGSFDPHAPSSPLIASEGSGDLEIYDAPGAGPRSVAGCQRVARIAAGAASSSASSVSGVASSVRVAAGSKLEVQLHPVARLNGERYVTRVHYRVDKLAEPPLEVRFTAIAAALPFVPPRRTPEPTQPGLQSGVVIGPAGSEIHSDKTGRTRVQLHWDRFGARDETSGRWVRVAQRGSTESMLLPRIGWNVLTLNEEGSVDEPLLLARIHDAEHPPAYGLPDNKTRLVFKTATSPGGGSFNELHFEDSDGRQEMFLNASRDLGVLVLNDQSEHIERDHSHTVAVDRKIGIGTEHVMTTGNDRTRHIAVSETVSTVADDQLSVGGNFSEHIAGNRRIETGASHQCMVLRQPIGVGGGHDDRRLDRADFGRGRSGAQHHRRRRRGQGRGQEHRRDRRHGLCAARRRRAPRHRGRRPHDRRQQRARRDCGRRRHLQDRQELRVEERPRHQHRRRRDGRLLGARGRRRGRTGDRDGVWRQQDHSQPERRGDRRAEAHSRCRAHGSHQQEDRSQLMAERFIDVFVTVAGHRLSVRRMRGDEAMSQPFRYEVELPLDVPLSTGEALRAPAVITLERQGQLVRRIDGEVSDVSIRRTATGAPDLTLVIEPRLAFGRYRSNMRIFRDMDAIAIVMQLLAELGVSVERRLGGAYASRPYCVQMRETDLDFIHRLLEDEGVGYFIRQTTVVLFDAASAYEDIGPLPYRGEAGFEHDEEAIIALADRAQITAGSVTMRDFNPDHPSLDMEVSAAIGDGAEIYDYPGEYLVVDDGQRKAVAWSEAIAATATILEGRSIAAAMAPGHRFELVDAPFGDVVQAHQGRGSWVARTVEVRFDRDEGSYQNRFSAADAAIPWRPPRATAEPVIPNPMIGYVTGPAGSDIHTDAIGRVKVHFPWDRTQPHDDTCSDWIPVVQDNTGHSVAIPRVGWEVVVGYLEGDPDRPVVLGRAYNPRDPLFEALPQHKTRSALRSMTSPQRKSANVWRFEDKAGQEEVYVHASRDQVFATANDKRSDVVRRVQHTVGQHQTTSIGRDDRWMIGADMRVAVGNNDTTTVDGPYHRTTGGNGAANVGVDHVLTIGGDHQRRIGTACSVVANKLSEKVGGVCVEASLTDNSITAGAAGSLMVGGALVELALKDKSHSTKIARAELVGGLLFSKSGKVTSAKTKAYAATVGGALSVTAGKEVTFDAGLKLTGAAALSSFGHGKNVTLRVGPNSVVLADGKIMIATPSDIVVNVSGDAEEGAGKSAQN